jgi:hypothetical protein
MPGGSGIVVKLSSGTHPDQITQVWPLEYVAPNELNFTTSPIATVTDLFNAAPQYLLASSSGPYWVTQMTLSSESVADDGNGRVEEALSRL